MYEFVDAAVIRAAARPPIATDAAPWPDGREHDPVPAWRGWLRQVWALDDFARGVEAASPELARQVRNICAGNNMRERDVRRTVLSVLRYLLRASHRATPFGLFAGVAAVRPGPVTTAFGEDHRAIARVDAEWLAGLIDRLERNPILLRRLTVVRNNLAFVRDGRLVVAFRPQSGGEPVEVSVRHTDAVRLAIDTAHKPLLFRSLVAVLKKHFPNRPTKTVSGMVTSLVAQGLLITSLRPPLTSTDPLGHVIDALTDADDISEIASLITKLQDIHARLDKHKHASPSEQASYRTETAHAMRSVQPEKRPLAVDLRIDCKVTIPHSVTREAARTATLLAQLSPQPFGPPAWREYHQRFCDRYGIGALVPVSDLVDLDSGLGFPAGYRGSHRTTAPAAPTERDFTLLEMAQNAALHGDNEVALDDTLIQRLSGNRDKPAQMQPHTELRCRVHARSHQALQAGDFELAITGCSRAAGTTTARFLDLLDNDDIQRIRDAYARLPTVSNHAVLAQAHGQSVDPRTDNVARSPHLLPLRVPLGEHIDGSDGVFDLSDLAVTADADRLYLVSLARRRPVEPIVFNAMEFTHHAHPMLRFLCEIAASATATCAPFTWGLASRLPFLPRVRYKRSILSPAMWRLSSDDVPGRCGSSTRWSEALLIWREKRHVPDLVYVGETDQRLRLDLTEPSHRALLRSELDRHGQTVLREAPDNARLGWIGGRAHDLVLPLASTQHPLPHREWAGRPVHRDRGHQPGGSWLYVKLYGHPARQDTILTSHLPKLLAAWDNATLWWFLRYHDPEPHLRLRIREDSAAGFATAAQRVSEWTSQLRSAGLLGTVQWDTYYPETGRFGPGPAMTAAENLFATDSNTSLAMLHTTSAPDAPDRRALLAASMVDLAISASGSIAAGQDWLRANLQSRSEPPVDRAVYDQALALADPHDNWAALRATPGGDTIVRSWAQRRDALQHYDYALNTADGRTAGALLSDLLHLHHARVVGIDPNSERTCRRLAHASALGQKHRDAQ